MQAGGGRSILAQIANSAYCGYSLFVSEAIAPWFWQISIPLSIAITVCVWCTASSAGEDHRVYFWMFWVLFGGLAIAGALVTKRLLFITPWLLIAIGTALTSPGARARRRMLLASLIGLGVAGWAGMVGRQWYAAPHFVEPWEALARDAARQAEGGATIVSNSPSFLFYANYAFAERGLLRGPFQPGWIADNRVVGPGESIPAGEVLLFEGVNITQVEAMETLKEQLAAKCKAMGARELLPDYGYALKQRFFGGAGQREYRIAIRSFRCGEGITPLVRPE